MYRRHSRQKIYGKKRQIIGDDSSKVIYHKKEKGEGSEEHKKFWKLQGTEAVQQKEQEYSKKNQIDRLSALGFPAKITATTLKV